MLVSEVNIGDQFMVKYGNTLTLLINKTSGNIAIIFTSKYSSCEQICEKTLLIFTQRSVLNLKLLHADDTFISVAFKFCRTN